MADLTPSQMFLLKWLSKEDISAYGECAGRDLNELVARGLAAVGSGASPGYERVILTDAGHEVAKTVP